MVSLLAIDTSSPISSAGLLHRQKITSKSSSTRRQAAQEILPMVDDLLLTAGLSLSKLTHLAIVSGPGSFTGLRIGMGVVQGLAAALELPVIPISSLALQAWSAARLHGFTHWLVAQTAREDEVYFAAYEIGESGCRLIKTEQVCAPTELDLTILQTDSGTEPVQWAVVGEPWRRSELLAECPGIKPQLVAEEVSNIKDLCELALSMINAGVQTTELPLPNYVKEQIDYT